MKHVLSRSAWRKALVLVVAMVAFVLWYETRIFDSQYAAFQALITNEGPPPAGSRLAFAATAYCKGTTTASGVTVRTGVAAADPAILPVGSVVNVAAGNPKYSGVYTIMDTGPEVQGRELDLYMWSCHEALRFGRKQIDVTVLRLGWDPQASSPSLINRLFRRREAARKIPAPAPPPPAGVPPSDVSPSETQSADTTTTSAAAPAPAGPAGPAGPSEQ